MEIFFSCVSYSSDMVLSDDYLFSSMLLTFSNQLFKAIEDIEKFVKELCVEIKIF